MPGSRRIRWLPAGGRRKALARGFRGIDEFVVYSTFQCGLYADTFGIVPERLVHLPWALLAGSEAMVLPLRDGETACGHITLVAARQLGIPVITTDSRGLADCVAGGRVAALVPPQDPEAISAALATVVGNSTLRAEARAGTQRAEAEHAPSLWVDSLRSKAAHLRG